MTHPTMAMMERGDLVVEAVKSELHFWRVGAGGKLRHVARSAVRNKKRRLEFRAKKLAPRDAPRLTKGKVYATRDLDRVFEELAAAFKGAPRFDRVHLYHTDHGPSGKMWGASIGSPYYTIARPNS